jgi:hypothetical protein
MIVINKASEYNGLNLKADRDKDLENMFPEKNKPLSNKRQYTVIDGN